MADSVDPVKRPRSVALYLGFHCSFRRIFLNPKEYIIVTKSVTGRPRYAKTCPRAYAESEGPDQPAHPRSLIRAFTVRVQNHRILQKGTQRPG